MLKKAIVLSALLWAISLLQPALLVNGDDGHWYGMDILAIGWLGILAGQLAWLANITLVLTWILNWGMQSRFMIVTVILTMVFAVQVFLTNSLSIPLDESGACCRKILEYRSGAYFWFASILVMCTGCVVYKIYSRRTAVLD